MPDIIEPEVLVEIDPTANEAELVARFIREEAEAIARVAEARARRDAALAAVVGTDSEES
jgi:hypothetical protein